MKVKIIFTIGIGLDAQNNEISYLTYKELSTKTFKAVAKAFGGYTAKETLGGWIDDNGNLIEEKSLQIECLHEIEMSNALEVATREAEILAFSLCALWNQYCVVCEIQETNFSFVSQYLTQEGEKGDLEDEGFSSAISDEHLAELNEDFNTDEGEDDSCHITSDGEDMRDFTGWSWLDEATEEELEEMEKIDKEDEI